MSRSLIESYFSQQDDTQTYQSVLFEDPKNLFLTIKEVTSQSGVSEVHGKRVLEAAPIFDSYFEAMSAQGQDGIPPILALVHHFPADVKETLFAGFLYAQQLLGEDFARFRHLQWVQHGATWLDELELLRTFGCASLFVTGCFQNLGQHQTTLGSLRAKLSQLPPTLFLIDLSTISLEKVLEQKDGESSLYSLGKGLEEFRKIVGKKHGVIVGVPHQYLVCSDLRTLLANSEKCVTCPPAPLFSSAYQYREDRFDDLVGNTAREPDESGSLTAAVRERSFLKINSNAFIYEFASYVTKQGANPLENGHVDLSNHSQRHMKYAIPDETHLLTLATRLFHEGYLELAYRLELICCTGRVQKRSPVISLTGELMPWDSPQGINEPRRVLGLIPNLKELPKTTADCFLVGPRGAGKTTLFRQLLHHWATPQLWTQGKLFPTWLPHSIRLGLEGDFQTQFTRTFRFEGLVQTMPANVDLLAHSYFATHATAENFSSLVSSPLYYLLDDLDQLSETRSEGFPELLNTLQRVQRTKPSGKVLSVQERHHQPELGGSEELGWYEPIDEVRVLPLNDEKFRELLDLSGLDKPLKQKMICFAGRNDLMISRFLKNPYLATLICKIAQALGVRTVCELTHYNLYLTVSKYLRVQIGRVGKKETERLMHWLSLVSLQKTAFKNETYQLIMDDDLLTLAKKREILRRGSCVPPRFSHNLLQDCCFAWSISSQLHDGSLSCQDFYTKVSNGVNECRKRDLLRFVCGCLNEKGFHPTLEKLLDYLVQNNAELAHVCLLDLAVTENRSHNNLNILKQSQITGQKLVAALEQPSPYFGSLDSTELRDHIGNKCTEAETLGFLDPRLVHVEDQTIRLRLLTPDPLKPTFPDISHLVPLTTDENSNGVMIGRFPVTNREFAEFILDGGYQNEAYWPPSVWQFKQEHQLWSEPQFWLHEQFSKPNLPVVGVSFYEAVAYTNWLTACAAREQLPWNYRLPTESEWNLAGGILDLYLLKFLKSNAPHESLVLSGPRTAKEREAEQKRLSDVMVTQLDAVLEPHRAQLSYPELTPVGIFGRNEHGCYDLFGNVWEWTDSWVAAADFPPSTGDIVEMQYNSIWMKGGPQGIPTSAQFPAQINSGQTNSSDAMLIIGGYFDPFLRFHRAGFRVCCTVPMPVAEPALELQPASE